MSAPINNTIPNDSNTTVHTEGITNSNVTAPTDHYGIAQKPVPERADAQQGMSLFAEPYGTVTDEQLLLDLEVGV